MVSRSIIVTVECDSCSGSGLYQGFMEGKGRAVVCTSCGGEGRQKISFKPFTGRRKRRGIKEIRFGSGLIIDAPSDKAWFSYAEFEKAVPAPKVKS